MNFMKVKSLLALTTPMLTKGFQVVSRGGGSRGVSTTSLAARRSLSSVLRRRSPFFSDIDRMFEEMNGLMESSIAPFERPLASSLFDGRLPGNMQLRHPSGGSSLDVSEYENEYTLSMDALDVDLNDLSLSLDKDGRVMRLKGQKYIEDGGMTVQSRFEKAVLLSPDVDTDKISASISEGTLTVVAPKIDQAAALEQAQGKEIEIKVGESKASLEDARAMDEQQQEVDNIPEGPTKQVSAQNLKVEKTKSKNEVPNAGSKEKKWPARDFPY